MMWKEREEKRKREKDMVMVVTTNRVRLRVTSSVTRADGVRKTDVILDMTMYD